MSKTGNTMSLIFITGVNGFIGSSIAEKFLAKGHKVRGLLRKTSDQTFLKGLDVELYYGDITMPKTLIEPLEDVDIVIHVAGLASDWGSYERFYEINCQGMINVATAADSARVKRFVHIGSAAVYGFAGFRDRDETAMIPDTIFPYCQSKKAAEEWLKEFKAETQMGITVIRPGNVYGVNDHTFIEKYLDAIVQGKCGYINRGRSLTCPCNIRNLCEAVYLASFSDAAAGEGFIVTDGLDITWREFTEALCKELGVNPPVLTIPFSIGYAVAFLMEKIYLILGVKTPPLLTRYRVCNGGRDYHFSIKKIERLLCFSSVISLSDAINETIKWYKGRSSPV